MNPSNRLDPKNKSSLEIKIITPETSAGEIIELSLLSGPSDEAHYKKLMLGFIANSLSKECDLDKGIVYGLYSGNELVASTRLKQDEYTFDAVSIEYLAVKPEYQGQEYGTLFMQGLFKEIKETWNKELVILATSASKGFYEKIGMEIMGQIKFSEEYTRFYFYKWV